MSHYFDTPAGPGGGRRRITATVWGHELEFDTEAGVFSRDGLDLGTAVLLRTLRPEAASTRVLDLGCGWGPIAVALARELPAATVTAVDVNERAVELCRTNAARAGVADRVNAVLPDEVDAGFGYDEIDAGVGYDEIWSNPPIRIGKAALHELLLQWLPRLAPGGVAHLVVGRNLGADSLQGWLIEQGYRCERVASAKGFRVLTVRPAG